MEIKYHQRENNLSEKRTGYNFITNLYFIKPSSLPFQYTRPQKPLQGNKEFRVNKEKQICHSTVSISKMRVSLSLSTMKYIVTDLRENIKK